MRIEDERPTNTLDAVLAQVPALVWTTDADLRIVTVDGREASRFAGGRALGRPVADFFDDDAPAVRVHRAALRGQSGCYDHHAHGVPWRVWTEPLYDGDAIVGAVSVALDLSERVSHRRELATAADNLRTLVETLPLVPYTVGLDESPHPIFVAPQVEELLGIPPDRFTFEVLRDGLHPDDRERVAAMWDDADVHARNLKVEYRFVRPDGRVVWIEDNSRVVEVAGTQVAQGYLLDVTDRKETEEKLARRTTVRHRLAIVGRRSLEGASREWVVGECLALLRDDLGADMGSLAEADGDELRIVDCFGAARSIGTIAREGSPAYTAFGSRATYAGPTDARPGTFLAERGMRDTIAVPVQCDGRDLFGAVAVHSATEGFFDESDVALVEQVATLIGAVVARERYDARTRMSQRLEAVGQLAAGIAHDFNNMLTVISGYAAFAQRHADAAGRTHLDHVLSAAERARALTSQLLAYSRQQVLQRRALDLAEVVTGVVPMITSTLGENVVVVVERGEAQRVSADDAQLANVLVNLTLNARDAMPGGGTLTIRHGVREVGAAEAALHEVPAGRYGVLAVSDTGTGMPPEVQARIFEPFFTTKEPGKGTGLGLAGAYGTIRQTGGFIAVESAVGEGTTMTVHLPLANDCAAAPEREEEAPPAVSPRRILLVEDEAVVRGLLTEQLELAGHTVTAAESAADALAVLDAVRHDLVLADVGLPGTDGAALAQTVLERHPGVAVILMSGYPGDALPATGIPLLQKPFGERELRRAIADVLG